MLIKIVSVFTCCSHTKSYFHLGSVNCTVQVVKKLQRTKSKCAQSRVWGIYVHRKALYKQCCIPLSFLKCKWHDRMNMVMINQKNECERQQSDHEIVEWWDSGIHWSGLGFMKLTEGGNWTRSTKQQLGSSRLCQVNGKDVKVNRTPG